MNIYIYIYLGFGTGMGSGGFVGVGQIGCGGFEEWVFENFRDGCGGMLKLV